MNHIITGLIALWFFLGATEHAHALPVAGVIAGLFFAAGTTAFTIASAVIGIALGVGLNIVASLLMRKSPSQDIGGTTGKLQGGGVVPRSFPLGKTVVTHSLVYANTFGQDGKTPNAYMSVVYALADLPVGGGNACLAEWWCNGSKVTYNPAATPETEGIPIPEFAKDGRNHLWIRVYDGTQTTADSRLVALFGSDADRPYGSDRVGNGVVYVVVTCRLNREVMGGVPQSKFVLNGIPLYDVRDDTTAGGDGSQRWATQSTWGASPTNPIVQAYNVIRGISYDGQWFYGGQTVSAAQLPIAAWSAAANECDALVDKAGGGTEAQFTAAGEVRCDMEPGDVLDMLLIACNGRMGEVGGVYKPHVGAASSAVLSITDDDILSTSASVFNPFKGLAEQVNFVTGKYIEPGEGWAAKDAPELASVDLEAIDGRRNPVDVTYDFVTNGRQVQRLMKSALLEARRERTHVLPMPPDAYFLEPAVDTISWTSTRNGYVNKLFRVDQFDDEDNIGIGLAVTEVDPSDYDWNANTDEQAIVIAPTPLVFPPSQTIEDFAVEPITISAAAGVSKAGIRITWDGDDLDDVIGVEWQVWTSDLSALVAEGVTAPSTVPLGEALIEVGLVSSTTYKVRARFVPGSGRSTSWSSYATVTTQDVRVDFDALDDLLQAEVEKAQAALDDASDIRKAISQIPDVRASIAGKLQFPLYDLMAQAARSIDYVLGQVQTTKDRITSAGIEVDSASGRVVIRGVDQLRSETQTQLSAVQATFDAQNAAISLRATKAELDAAVEAVLASFTPAYRWEFNGTAEGWTGSDATLTTDVGSLDVEATDTGAYIESPTLALDADLNRVVALRIKRLAGTGWGLNLQWGASYANSRAISVPAAPDEWNILRLDQTGQTGWEGELTGLRLTVEDGTEVEIDYIEVGNSAINDLIVGDLSLRMSEAEIRLDAAESAIDLRATLVDLGEATDRITSAETRLDAAEAAITLRVTQLEREEDLERLSTVEISLDAANNRITSTVSSAETNADLISFLASAVTNGLLNSLKNFHDLNTALAYASQTLGARIDETGAAVSSLRTELTAFAGSSSALFYQETVARAAADEALTTQLTVQSAALAAQDDRLTDAESAIATETITRAAADTALASAQTVISASLSTKARTFYQPSMPAWENTGDIWVDSDDANRIYRWSGVAWISTQDGIRPTVFAQTSAPTANAIDDIWVDTDGGNAFTKWDGSTWASISGVSKFYQATKPTGTTAGDLWVHTGESNRLYRFSGPIWSEITGITRFYQNTVPTATAVGDLWIDWSDGNAISRWDGSEWVLIEDVDTYYQTTAPTGIARGTLWIDSDDSRRAFTYSGAEWLTVQSGTKNTVFAQDAAPVAMAVGDVWYDTNDNNKPYRWNGSSWVAVQDGGKNRVFAQDGTPTATAVGDLWFDTNDGNKPYRWDGTSWVETKDGRLTTAEGTITTLSTTKVDAAGAAAAATTVINSRFGTEDAPGSIEAQISTLSSTKVDATGAAAAATSVVEARFGEEGEPGSIDTVVTEQTGAISNLEGETYGSYSVLISTQKNIIGTTVQKVSGFSLRQAGGGGTVVSEFRINSDKFSVFPADSDPAVNTYDTPFFTVGSVSGGPANRAGLNALAVLDGTLQARMLKADEVVVSNTIQLQNSIVTVPHVITYSTPVAGTGIGNLIDIVDTMFEVTVPNGQSIPIFFNGGMSLEYLNTSTTRWDLDFKVSWRNVGGSYGTESSLFAMTCGSTATVSAPFGGAYTITGTGAIQQVRARLIWTAASNIRAGNRYLSCQAAKR